MEYILGVFLIAFMGGGVVALALIQKELEKMNKFKEIELRKKGLI